MKRMRILAFLLLAVLSMGVLTACGGGYPSSEAVAEAMLGAFQSYDAKTLLALLPAEYLETYYEEEVTDEEEYLEDLQDVLDDFAQLMEELEGSCSFEVTGKEALEKKELRALNKALGDYLEKDVEEAEAVTFEVTFSYTYDQEAYESVTTGTLIAFAYRGNWYLDPNSIPRTPNFFLGVNYTPESALAAMFDVMNDLDIRGFRELLSEDMWEKIYRQEGVTEEKFWKELEDAFDEMKDEMDTWDLYKVVCEIKDIDKQDDLEKLQGELKDLLKDDIEAAVIVEVEMTLTIEYDGEDVEMDDEREYTVFKYDGKWYLHPDVLDMF
ncbi:MAG: hypothetical protein IJW34_02205 [Clostridia bacterium]|nr:hypothetical protein [Clostridia bacterium]